MDAWKFWPFRSNRARLDAERLLSTVSRAARARAYYREGGVPDTLDGRLELLKLHAALAVRRLNREPGHAPLAQQFVDRLFSHIDAGLREDGVGDLTVPKRMRKIAGGFLGRLQAYEAAIAAGEAPALADALARNIGVGEPFALDFARHVLALAANHDAGVSAALLDAESWPSLAASS